MKATIPVDLFDPEFCIGTVTEVGPRTAKANLAEAAGAAAASGDRDRFGRGKVGDFVIVELDDAAILGRVIEVRLSKGEAATVQPGLRQHAISQPVATMQLLSTITLPEGKVEG